MSDVESKDLEFRGSSLPAGWLLFAWLLALPSAIVLLFGLFYLMPRIMPPDPPPEAIVHLLSTPGELGAGYCPKFVDKGRFLWAMTTVPMVLGLGTLAGLAFRAKLGIDARKPAPAWGIAILLVQAALFMFLAWMEMRQDPRILMPEGGFVRLLVVASGAMAIGVSRRKWPEAWNLVAAKLNSRLGIAASIIAFSAYCFFILRNEVLTEGTLYTRVSTTWYHLPFLMGEFEAIHAGRTSLVNFFPQYQNLVPYLTEWYFTIFGFTVTTYSFLMVALTVLGFSLTFDLLRQVTGSTLAGLALAVPITSFSSAIGLGVCMFSNAPARFIGPWFLAWLLVRYLASPSTRKLCLLSFVGWLTMINCPDFGTVALGAMSATLFLAGDPHGRSLLPTRRYFLELSLALFAGAVAAFGLVAIFTFIRSGQLPQWGKMTEYSRAFAVLGLVNLPTPRVGTYWLVYASYMIGIGAMLVRLAWLRGVGGASIPERLYCGVILFLAVFGTGIMSYYFGRSVASNLSAVMFPWLTMSALMLWSYWNRCAEPAEPSDGWVIRIARWAPGVPISLLILLACTFVPGPSTIVSSPEQMQSSRKEWEDMVNFQAAVIQVFARPDDQVCDMMIHGHLCCAQNDVRNIYPFATVDSLMLRSQVDQVLDVIESSRTNLVFGNIFPPEMVRRLPELGFRRVPKFSDRLTSTWYRPTPDRPVPDGIELAPREKPVNSGIQPVGAR